MIHEEVTMKMKKTTASYCLLLLLTLFCTSRLQTTRFIKAMHHIGEVPTIFSDKGIRGVPTIFLDQESNKLLNNNASKLL